MFKCFACSRSKIFQNATAFLAHLQFYHSKLQYSGTLICTHSDCKQRKFDKINSFRKHVKSHKLVQDFQSVPACDLYSEPQKNLDKVIEPQNSEDEDSSAFEVHDPPPISSKEFDVALTDSVVAFIA